ncbi:MAG: hypothetical protein KF825_06440 [Ferruginibacter sp.]|nr:hypothetical protein [Ferruginibacter sp.]
MKEKNKTELKEEVEEISEILFLAQESLKVVRFLIKEEDDDDRAYTKRVNAFFVYTTSIYWRVIVIELCKLFSTRENEDYRLHKFISKLKANGHFGDAGISPGLINQWETDLENEKDVIDNLILQRNKIYAHKDRNSKAVVNTVTLKKTTELIEVVQKIIREIYFTVFETSFLVNDPINAPVQNLEYIVNVLADEKKRREKPWRKLAKEHGIEGEFKD